MKKELSIILPIFNEKESLAIMVRLLNSYIKFNFEIILVYDDENDNALETARLLKKEFSNLKIFHNNQGKGVKYAVDVGIKNAIYETIIIFAVDEMFPIIAIEKMLEMMSQNDLDFISGTRYRNGGRRLGGSILGSVFSRLANNLFQSLTKIPFSDCTTGIKLMKKKVWNSINLESKPIGWAFSFELSIKVYLLNYNIGEYPLKSVDRLFGGSSTFKFGLWLKEYLKWFLWGLIEIKKKKISK